MSRLDHNKQRGGQNPMRIIAKGKEIIAEHKLKSTSVMYLDLQSQELSKEVKRCAWDLVCHFSKEGGLTYGGVKPPKSKIYSLIN